MPRKFFKKLVPDHNLLRQEWYMRPFDALLHHPALWTLHRRSVSKGAAVGVFCAMLPFPIQMALAALAAILMRVNVPVAVLFTWVTNPVTVGPIFYLGYRFGVVLLGVPEEPFQMELTIAWLTEGLWQVWKPLLAGCLVLAVTASAITYTTLNLVWRFRLLYLFRNRHAKRRQQAREGRPQTGPKDGAEAGRSPVTRQSVRRLPD